MIPTDQSGEPPLRARRRWIAPIIGALTVVLGVALLAVLWDAEVPYRNDFAAYWPVGRLLSEGANPYDASAIAEIQVEVGDDRGGDSVVRYPPWALPLLIPMSRVPYARAWHLWIILQLLLVIAATAWMTSMLSDRWKPPAPAAVAILFPPTLIMVLGGQIGGLLLIAATAFMSCCNERRQLFAGICLGLLSIKPHLFIPLGLLALLWSFRERTLWVPITAMATIGIGSSIAWLLRPEVFREYVEFVRVSAPTGYLPLSIGGLLRSLLNPESFWLQWIPALLAIPLVLGIWVRASSTWDWILAGPAVLAFGVATAPYGLVHDLVLLIPVLLISAGFARSLSGSRDLRLFFGMFAAMSVLIWLGQVRTGTSFVQVWVAPVSLLMWWFWRHRGSAVNRHLNRPGPGAGG